MICDLEVQTKYTHSSQVVFGQEATGQQAKFKKKCNFTVGPKRRIYHPDTIYFKLPNSSVRQVCYLSHCIDMK